MKENKEPSKKAHAPAQNDPPPGYYEVLDSRSPALGAQLVVRAWVDPAFKQRLLDDSVAAALEFGIDQYDDTDFVVLENTEKVHNLICCTLCSCYPRAVLGLAPAWYKSPVYRSRAVREPRMVLKEFGTVVPDDVEILVSDSTANLRYMVLPRRPEGTEHYSEEQLKAIVTRDCMIGVALPRV